MSRKIVPVLAAVALWNAPVGPAAAAPPTCGFVQVSEGVCGDQRRPPSAQGGTAGRRAGGGRNTAPVSQGVLIERRYAPACAGNSVDSAELICPSALALCQATPGAVALWVWVRQYDPRRPAGAQPPFVRQPGFVCLNPQAAQVAQVPTVAQVAALVQGDFQRFVVVKGETVIDPPERTLVNVDTIFSTPTNAPVTLDPITLLGRRVVITIKPETYTWHFGDGTTRTTTTPGRPRVKDVAHVYRRAAAVSPYVVISWSGTFTVDGSEALTVQGRATTTGPGTPLRVLTAQSELVAR